MNNDILITILAVLLGLNFVFWLAFLIFIFFQVRKIFKHVNSILENMGNLSASVASGAVKAGALLFGLFKGFNAVRSINTLSDVFDFGKGEENGKEGK
jgi:hypothetical protein